MNRLEIETAMKALMSEWCNSEPPQDMRKKVQYAGPLLGPNEYHALLDALFSNWWSGGRFTVDAERKLASQAERNHALLFNSGSSANLALMHAARELYFKDDDKILTLSCGFPTTVNPIFTARMRPVFVDISLDDLGLNPEVLENALKSDSKIRGVFVAHTLGFVQDIVSIIEVCRKYDVLCFFDSCDAYGSSLDGKPITAYGKASTYSFYVAHHLTMGEGGGVVTNDTELHQIMRGFRNWGRYCASDDCCVRSTNRHAFCPPAKLTKKCDLPEDYIVNYQYEWMGFNLKPLELQAAMLQVQLDRLTEFNATRIRNYNYLKAVFDSIDSKYIRTWDLKPGCSPFAFPVLIKPGARFTRKHIIDCLKRDGIETRLLFGGNLMRHPAYKNKVDMFDSFGDHANADLITEQFLMLGVSQIITDEQVSHVAAVLQQFFARFG